MKFFALRVASMPNLTLIERMLESEHGVLRMLSLDGGGIKALYSASVLAEWERQMPGSWTQRLDWISGTSSGGILALGLASGHSASDLGAFFVNEGPAIFPAPPRGLRAGLRQLPQTLRQLRLQGKYDPRMLHRALCSLFGDRCMADLATDVSVAAVNLTTGEHTVFMRSSHPHVRLVDVAMATAATPGYFPHHNLNGEWYADGGLWVNSPTLSGLIHALPKAGTLNQVEIVSIGTVERPEGYQSSGPPRSLPQWIQRMLHASTYGQAALTHDAVATFLPRIAPVTRYVRIPPPAVPWAELGPVRMDTTHPAALEFLSASGSAEGVRHLQNPAVRAFIALNAHG